MSDPSYKQEKPVENQASDMGAEPEIKEFTRGNLSQSTVPIRRRSLWRTVRWFILLLIFSSLLAAGGGYLTGQRQREQNRRNELHQIIQEQFALGLVDLNSERFELARQRFEYIIELDPGFPEAADYLAEALVGLNEPIIVPTVTPLPFTPTPNLAPVEEIFEQALAALEDDDWSTAIDIFLVLRAKDPTYKTVEVDGWLYAALRNRGIERISRDQDLEEGIYDLSLAESFAPLDEEAGNWRSWAELYLRANSFFGLNWGQAVELFDLVFVVAPGIKNDVYWKYAFAAQSYGDQLLTNDDPCASLEQYDKSLQVQPNDNLVPTATHAFHACLTATAEPPKPTKTETPIPGGTPAGTPTPTSVGGPTASPGPTNTPVPPTATETPGTGDDT